jgi:uncharacterized cofD-like protein
MQKIVLIGGGSGISPLLTELSSKKDVEVSAVVTVFDNGGSSGILRKKFGIPAVGDFRKCVSATAGLIAKSFEQRDGKHAFGNLILADLIREEGVTEAFEMFAKFGAAKVFPVSFSSSQLVGKLESGEKIIGEEKFDHPPKRLAKSKIVSISLQPKAKLNPEVERLLKKADKIVVGPGSLFGSLLVNFEVIGFRQAFGRSKAKKTLVMNAKQEFGCRGESEVEIVERFGVEFDEILIPPKNSKQWRSVLLSRKICACI